MRRWHIPHGQAGPLRDEACGASPDRFAAGLAKALDSNKPFVRRSVGPDARMLLIANRLLPAAGLHHMTRLMMGIPRFGAHDARKREAMPDTPDGSFRIEDADRRQARRRRGRHLRQHQPGHRGGARRGRRRVEGRHAPRHRRRPARVRRDGLVDQPRVPQALPRCSCRRRSRPSRRSCARSSSSRSAARARSRTARSSTRRSPTRCSYPAKLIDEYPWETDRSATRSSRSPA